MRYLAGTLTLTVLAVFGPGRQAMAAEYCVTCASPEANYRCEIGGKGSAGDPRAWLLCITELAKQGGHESCSVDRKATAPCPGVLKVLAAPEGDAPPLPAIQTGVPEARPPDPKTQPPVQPQAGSEPAPKKVPQTMQELAGDTIQSSKDGMKKAGEAVTGTAKKAGEQVGKAGDAIGNAAKKTWDCLTSLFQSC